MTPAPHRDEDPSQIGMLGLTPSPHHTGGQDPSHTGMFGLTPSPHRGTRTLSIQETWADPSPTQRDKDTAHTCLG